MITHDLDYHRATSIEEAVGVLAAQQANAKVLAGGTDLLLRIADGLDSPSMLLDVKTIPALAAIEREDGFLRVGATVTFGDLIRSPLVRHNLPLLWEASRAVGSVGTRNRATLVGNLCSAVPSLDGGPPMLVHEASIVAQGPKGERLIPIDKWFVGPRETALGQDEMVTGVRIPLPAETRAGCFIHLGRYRGEDCAQVGVAVLALPGAAYRVAFCALGPVSRRAPLIKQALRGAVTAGAELDKAVALVEREIAPITDHRASREYRLHMSRLMLRRTFEAAIARRDGDGPAYGTALV